VTIEIRVYDVETHRSVSRWTPAEIQKAVLRGVDLECPFWREKGTEFSQLCQCKLTPAIHPCCGYIVLNVDGTGHPCEEGEKELRRLDTPPSETEVPLILRGLVNVSRLNAGRGGQLRSNSTRRGR
jgi:hypothetical protein